MFSTESVAASLRAICVCIEDVQVMILESILMNSIAMVVM